jgi:hypothetical protein
VALDQPCTSLRGLSSPRLSSARLARASARSIRWFCTRFSRSCGPGDEVQPSLLGSARPGQQFPGDCLRLLADLHPDSIDHALQVGLQPPALPGSATSTLSSSSRASQIGHLGMSAPSDPRCVPRRRMRQSVLAAKLAFPQPALVLDRSSLSLVQPSGADPPPSAGRPHVPPSRAAPTSSTCSSSATRGWSVVTAGVLGRARVADLLVRPCPGRKARAGGSVSACRTTLFARCRWPG